MYFYALHENLNFFFFFFRVNSSRHHLYAHIISFRVVFFCFYSSVHSLTFLVSSNRVQEIVFVDAASECLLVFDDVLPRFSRWVGCGSNTVSPIRFQTVIILYNIISPPMKFSLANLAKAKRFSHIIYLFITYSSPLPYDNPVSLINPIILHFDY